MSPDAYVLVYEVFFFFLNLKIKFYGPARFFFEIPIFLLLGNNQEAGEGKKRGKSLSQSFSF